jgi:trans-2,3-dihydro-3-hydroxyanthranilate isomerase
MDLLQARRGTHRANKTLAGEISVKSYDYHVVDVFTTEPLEGNALAVFPDARGLEAGEMQRIAREFNLSETTFVFPPERESSVARVRIFTPVSEMEFAGHPTIGTAAVLRATGAVPADTIAFDFDENVGPVAIRVDVEPALWLTTPPVKTLGVVDAGSVAKALTLDADSFVSGVPCEIRSAGNPLLFIATKDAATVDRAFCDTGALAGIAALEPSPCLYIFARTEGGTYARMFAPHLGVVEDPATGSAAGPLASFMMAYGLIPDNDGTRFVNEQGTKMGRRSLIHVLIHGQAGIAGIEVGGNVAPMATGTLTIPEVPKG